MSLSVKIRDFGLKIRSIVAESLDECLAGFYWGKVGWLQWGNDRDATTTRGKVEVVTRGGCRIRNEMTKGSR